ncbi:MAG TPA: carboxypeptidase regulatory-like domain-containing protein, partial [Lysobacter sp.]
MTHPNRVRMSRLTLGLLAALATAPAFAQSTSAGVGGVVVGADGQPVAGAEVTIVHTESGTVSRAVTDASGRYTARGLRVGGPYTITINKAGAGTDVEENVFLQLNQVATVDGQLGSGGVTTLESVQAIAGVTSEVFSANKMGTGSNVTREAIEGLPSANRNIQDYIRLDPRISQVSKADGAISAGGQNTRYNAIRIDGVNTSDPFGLESNNLPTERQPVSMDAIEEINIDLANYDTTISGGTGAVINAVTKSGTNEFHGTAYYTLRDRDWVREDLRGVKFNGFNQEETYGATFGGPLIKDKLFFFTNYEKYTRTAPGTSLGETPYGRGQITDANIAEVQRIARDVYGFDAGSLSLPGNSKTEIEEYAAKIDWNINDNHRAALRYSKLEQSVLRFPNITNSQVSLSSFWYALPKTFESYVGEVFSDWSDNFSTEFKVSQRDYVAERATFSSLPSIRINFGNQALFLGTEQNSHINIVDTKETNFFGAGTWYVGDHSIKFGVDYQKNDILNFFGRNLYGVYEFDNLAAFAAGTPRRYQVRGPRAGGSLDDVPARYTLENAGLFLQDTWAINYNLNVMFGVRVDVPKFGDQRLYNPRIQELYGYDNTNTVDDALIQPRVGFNYTFDSERPTQLRGGVGLFGGAAPNVWIAGSYQNTGLNYVEYDVNNPGRVFTPSVNPPFYPGTPSSARQNVDIVEPGMRLPSVWKANLALDHELPWWGLVASAEVLLTDVNDGIYFERLDIGTSTAVGQDGRLIYWNPAGRNPANGRMSGVNNLGITEGTNGASARGNRPPGIGDVILMRNTNKGKGQQLTLALEKPLTDTWGWSLGYTYTHATEVSPLSSSQNTSNWNNT